MIAFGVWVLSTTVQFHADTFVGLSGIFVPTTSYEQIMTERNTAVERSLEASTYCTNSGGILSGNSTHHVCKV